MEMPLKPNVLEDIARDVRIAFLKYSLVQTAAISQRSIPPPPPLSKFCSPHDSVMLEDESGRIRLVGDRIREAFLVTGVVIAALGLETPNGDFEVIDICCAGMAPHSNPNSCEYLEDSIFRMDVDGMHRLSTATLRD
jgi:DNA polymerase delta subunit 2